MEHTGRLVRLEDALARAARAVRDVYVWPAVYAVAAASGAWALSSPDRLSAMRDNKLAQPERMGGLEFLAVAALAIVALYGLLVVAARVRTGRWRVTATVARLNAELSFVLAAPLLAMLATPRIESKEPGLTLLLCVLATACCVPAILQAVRPGRRPSRLGALLGRHARWLAPLCLLALMVGYGVFFSRLAIQTHHALHTGILDLGVYDNIFYQSIHGRPLACTFLKGGHHASGHFDPLLVLLSPLYLLYPRAELLLVLQSVWLASGAIPLYLLALRKLGSRLAGLALGALWLMYPATHGANLYEFHSLTLVATPLMWALCFLEAGQYKRYIATLAVLLLCREDVSLLLVFVGAHAVLMERPGSTRLGVFTIVVALAYFVVVKSFFMVSSEVFMEGDKDAYSFAYYYRDLIPPGEGLRGLLTSLLTNPGHALTHALTEPKLIYLGQVFLPLLGLPLLAPRGRIMMLYGLAFVLLATRKPVFSIHFQYSMVLAPVLFALTPTAVQRLTETRWPERLRLPPARLGGALFVAMLVSTTFVTWKFGALWENTSFRGGFNGVVRELTPTQEVHHANLRALVDQIEPGASVSATSAFGPHVSNRKEVYRYEQKKPTHYYLVDERKLKGKWKTLHKRRVDRGEIELVDGRGPTKLYRSRALFGRSAEPASDEEGDPPAEDDPPPAGTADND